MAYRILLKVSFIGAVVAGLLSQLPFLLQSSTSDLLKLSWFFPFLVCLIKTPRLLLPKASIPFYVFTVVFFLYCTLCQSINGYSYIGSDFRNIIISLCVFIISYATWRSIGNQRFLNEIGLCSLIASCIVGTSIYLNYLSQQSITAVVYAYASKNSAAQILLNAILLLYCCRFKNKILISGVIVISTLLFTEIFLLKSRATMVGILFVLIYFAFSSNNLKFRKYIWISLILITAYIIYDSSLFDMVVSNLILANRDSSDLNSLSSGRITLIQNVLQKFELSPWFGNGNLYIDCFPVSILAQYGILGASIILLFLTVQFKKIYIISKKHEPLYITSFLLLSTILLNSLFEAQPPFGPGMKCFTIWMVMGFSLASYSEHKVLK